MHYNTNHAVRVTDTTLTITEFAPTVVASKFCSDNNINKARGRL